MSETIIATSIIGICGLIITYAFNKKNTRLAKHKMQKELFTEFNSRYDKLNSDLNYITSLSYESFKTFDLGQESIRQRGIINDFFNLCAEEYYWYSKKRIPKRVWISWEKGMNDIYNKSEIIQKLWEEECQNEGFISYYIDRKDAFFKFRQ